MKKLLLGAAGLAVLLVGGFKLYSFSKLPVREGELSLSSLNSPVEVTFDQWAIPHIQAESEIDGFRALGFVHAQDRLFQMDVLRRVGKGELAALLGEPGVAVDKLFRTLGTREFSFANAKRIKAEQPELTALLNAYYDGINQAIEQLPTPVEYDILMTKPEPFSMVDGMGIFAYIAHSFTGGLSTDPLVSALQQKLPADHFEQLVLSWPTKSKQNVQPTMLQQEQLLSLVDNSEALFQQLPFGVVHGSNAWAITPSRSASGKALIANDPHIAFASPSVWYEAHLTSPEQEVYGHYLAGIPFPLLVRTPDLAQGLTMLTSDDADLIRLQYNDDQSEILVGGNWQKVSSRSEVIQVKGADSVEFEVKSSSIGPIVNHALNLKQPDPLALYWVYTMKENKPFDTIFGMYRAKTMEQMEAAMSKHWAPGLNTLYADAKGNIAQWAFGRYVIRPEGNNGKVIVDGTNPDNLPQGVYPFSHNPKMINPESGYLFSTNHAFPNSKPESEHLGYYSPVYRALWADEKLAQGGDWDIEKMQQLQTESANKRAELTIEKLKHALHEEKLSELEQQAWATLAQWDLRYTSNNAAPSIFERYYFYLLKGLYQDEMGTELFARTASKSLAGNSLFVLLDKPSSPWWNDKTTPAIESQEMVMSLAFKNAIASLVKEFGDQQSNWSWNKVASLTHNHPLGKVKPLDKLFNVGPYAVMGSRRALNNMQHKFRDDHLIVTNGPSTRRVIDFANVRQGYTALPTGQSGIVFDKHYDDQADLYHANGYRDAVMLKKGDKPQGAKVLKLTPVK